MPQQPHGQGRHHPDLNGLAFAGFQATFAIITVALISGAIADRAKFGAWMVFAGIWVTVVYFPVAFWVFNLGDGWARRVLHVNDFAGGTAVHINAGAAGLALALVLGKRVGFQKGMAKPHNVPLTLLGAALLWFGWFGFNAGSEAAVDGVAAIAWINTLAAPAAAILGWLIVEKIKDGKPTSIGAASGAVAGLVAITPACNILTPGSRSCSASSPAPSAPRDRPEVQARLRRLARRGRHPPHRRSHRNALHRHLRLHPRLQLQGRADRRPSPASSTAAASSSSGVQALGAFAVLIYSFVLAYAIGWVIQKTMGFRIKNEDELAGVDTVVHGEEGYALETV